MRRMLQGQTRRQTRCELRRQELSRLQDPIADLRLGTTAPLPAYQTNAWDRRDHKDHGKRDARWLGGAEQRHGHDEADSAC